MTVPLCRVRSFPDDAARIRKVELGQGTELSSSFSWWPSLTMVDGGVKAVQTVEVSTSETGS